MRNYDDKFVEELMKERVQLKQQLAEKNEEIEELKKEIRDELVDNNMAILELQQSQNQTAIAELEKVKKFFCQDKEDEEDEREYFAGVIQIANFIDYEISKLKGE